MEGASGRQWNVTTHLMDYHYKHQYAWLSRGKGTLSMPLGMYTPTHPHASTSLPKSSVNSPWLSVCAGKAPSSGPISPQLPGHHYWGPAGRDWHFLGLGCRVWYRWGPCLCLGLWPGLGGAPRQALCPEELWPHNEPPKTGADGGLHWQSWWCRPREEGEREDGL